MERQMDIWGKKKKKSTALPSALQVKCLEEEKAQGSLDGRKSWFITALAAIAFCIYLERWESHRNTCNFLGLIWRQLAKLNNSIWHWKWIMGSYFPLNSKLFTPFFSPILAWIHIGEENMFQSRYTHSPKQNPLPSQILSKAVQWESTLMVG